MVVLRFWKPMLDALVNFVVGGGYSRCCSDLQVRVNDNALTCSVLHVYLCAEVLKLIHIVPRCAHTNGNKNCT